MMDLVWQWQWRQPLWLWALLYPLVPALLSRLRRSRTGYAIDRALWPWMLVAGRRLDWRWWFGPSLAWWLGWSCLVIALAGPRLPDTLYQAGQTALRDVMVVVDVSRSMSAADVAPSRLRRARLELESLLPRVQQSRLGLVVFGARPHLVSPLTDDTVAFRHYLGAIVDELLPTEGSDPVAALSFALEQLSDTARPAALLLLSDGGYDRDTADFDTAWQGLQARLRARGVPLYILGIGSLQGAPLLAPEGGWLAAAGMAPLNESRLRAMAGASGGSYARVAEDDSDWAGLYQGGIARLGLAGLASRGEAELVWREYHRPFLIAAVLLLLFSLLRRRPGHARLSPLLVWLALGLVTLQSPPLRADDAADLGQAYDAYGQQAYELALQTYSRLGGYAARMGEASAAYQLQRYPYAVQQYTLAFLAARSAPQRADALFNLANSRFQQGDYDGAERVYRDVLRYAPGHKAATNNLAIAASLKESVAARLRVGRPAARPGRGPRSGTTAEGLELGDSGVTLGDEEETKTQPYALPEGEGSQEALIERGIRYSSLASASVEHKEDRQWQYDVADLQGLEAMNPQVGGAEATLWRRLFEAEEGYPAPVATPHPLPGRQPW